MTARAVARSYVAGEDDVDVLADRNSQRDTRASVRPTGRWWRLPPPVVGLVTYGAVLLALLPATPFEWDEVLFMRALDRYDVASHSPHPPGYPAFVAAGKVVHEVVADPQRALQLVSLAASLAALVVLWGLVRRLGGSRATAAGAAFLLATMPGFLYAAGVGMSDVAGTTAGLVGVTASIAALRRSAVLPAAATALALAAAIRPQGAAVVLLPFAAAVAMAISRRRWLPVAGAAATGVAVSTAFWLPAIAATGWTRWREAMAHQVWWITVGEAGSHLPAAAWDSLAHWWLTASFVGWEFAVPLWGLALVGAVVLVRSGRSGVAALAVAAAAPYLVLAVRAMNMTLSIRYFLPVAPFVAVLAAGGLESRRRWVQRLVGGTIVVWGLTAAAWTSPALLGRLHPTPVWAALGYVRDHFDAARTRVVYAAAMTPHVEYVLGRAGFSVVRADRFEAGPDGGEVTTLFLAPMPVPGCEVLFAGRSPSRRVAQLAWGRYGTCAVSRTPVGDAPVFSADWQVGDDGWRLWGTGTIRLPEGGSPRMVDLRPGHAPLTVKRQGYQPVRVPPWRRMTFPLLPGSAGSLEVSAPPDWLAVFEPPVVALLTPESGGPLLADEWVVPLDADRTARGERTDLYLYNPAGTPIRVEVDPAAVFTDGLRERCGFQNWLGPGEQRWVRDVASLAGCRGRSADGAVIVRSAGGTGGATFLAAARAVAAGAGSVEAVRGVPSLQRQSGIGPWQTAALSLPAGGTGRLSLLATGPRPVVVEVSLLEREGGTVGRRVFVVAGLLQSDLGLQRISGDVSMEVRLLEGPDDAVLFPFLALRDGTSRQPTYLLPEPGANGVRRAAILPVGEPSGPDRPPGTG